MKDAVSDWGANVERRAAYTRRHKTYSMKALLIWNPKAGPRDVRQELSQVMTIMETHGWRVTLKETSRPGDATRFSQQARQEHVDAVFAAGGDGTINEIVNGLAESQVALGVLPVGTGNIWAKQLGQPTRSPRHLRPALDSIRALLQGERRSVDLGRSNGRYFLQFTDIGLDAEVIQRMEPRSRRQQRLGAVAYVSTGLTTAFSFLGTRTRIFVDGARVYRRAMIIVIANSQLYGGVRLATDAQLDDGLLDVYVFQGQGFASAVRAALGVVTGLHVHDPYVDHFRGRQILIRPDKPLPMAVDGDPIGATPLECEVVPLALDVLVPRKVTPGLFGRPGRSILSASP
jgi:diacylglycerol kinase (ATP)